MSFESDLFTLLKLDCPRVFPDFAPVSTVRPYVTYQAIGGQVLNPFGNEVPGTRNVELQISVWADTRLSALALSRAIEDRMRGATTFIGRPQAAAASDYDADIPVYGCRQDFSCWFTG